MFKKLYLLLLILVLALSKKNKSINLYFNSTNDNYLPNELFDNYLEYAALEEYTNNTCNLESFIENNSKLSVLKKVDEIKCIPDYKTFASILENGWTEVAEKLIKNIYLDKKIDPINTLYTYINKIEGKINYFEQSETEQEIHEKLKIGYEFENLDNSINFKVKIPDFSFVLEHYSVFCYKDMFKLHAVFRARNKLYKIQESKQFFDLVDGECEHNYDSFSGTMNMSLNKVNKYKKWGELFK
jgi:hypothetical protein